MTTAAVLTPVARIGSASRLLNSAAGFWWLTAVLGQWAFFYYIVAFYGPATVAGNYSTWMRNTFLFKGYVPGDAAGNLAFAAHALLAATVAFGGALQLVPWIRTRATAFHRWNGRMFMMTALGVSVTGLYMVWVRHSNPTATGSLATSLNAVLIILCAAFAWRAIRARRIESHRRWALRLFVTANGQWFIRIGFFTWITLTQAVGIGKHMATFILIWDFGCFLLPLGVLELYLRAKESEDRRIQFAMASGLIVIAVLMSIGIFGISMFVWRPLLAKV